MKMQTVSAMFGNSEYALFSKLRFIDRKNFMLSLVEHKICLITLGTNSDLKPRSAASDLVYACLWRIICMNTSDEYFGLTWYFRIFGHLNSFSFDYLLVS